MERKEIKNLISFSFIIMTHKYFYVFLLCLIAFCSFAQEDSKIVEVYGLVLTKGELVAYEYVPFVTVALKGTNRGTYANY